MNFLQNIRMGDLLIGRIQHKTDACFILSPLCTDGTKRRYIENIGVKIIWNYDQAQHLNSVHEKVYDSYQTGDFIRAVVINYLVDLDKVYVSMKPDTLSSDNRDFYKLGLIADEEVPIYFSKIDDYKGKTYDDVLRRQLSFANPNASNYLCQELVQPPSNIHLSLLPDLHAAVYEESSFGPALRRRQSAKWASKS